MRPIEKRVVPRKTALGECPTLVSSLFRRHIPFLPNSFEVQMIWVSGPSFKFIIRRSALLPRN